MTSKFGVQRKTENSNHVGCAWCWGEIILVLHVNQKTPFERCRFVAKNVHFPNTANYSAVNTGNLPSMIHDPAVPEGHQLGFILC